MTLSKEVMKPRIHVPFHLLFMARIISWLVISHASALKYTYTRFVIFKLFDVKLLKKKQRFCSFECIHHLWVAGLLSWIKQPIVCVKGTIWHFDQYDCFLAESYNKCSFYILFFNMWLQVSAHSQLSLVKKASAS